MLNSKVLKVFKEYDIEVGKKFDISQINRQAIVDALDNFASIVREFSGFDYNYRNALKYGKTVFAKIKYVYVLDNVDRATTEDLSQDYPKIAALIGRDSKNRQWLYFDGEIDYQLEDE